MSLEALGHINAALPDLSIKVMQQVAEYNIHRLVFPPKPVQKMSDSYFIYDVTGSFRTAQDYRANAAESNNIDELAMSTATYVLMEHSLNRMVSDRDRENADASIDPEFDAVQDVTTTIARNKEVDCALKIFTTSTYGGSNKAVLSSNAWNNDTTTSSPIDDVDTARENLLQNTGKVPNGMVMGLKTWQVLKDHADLLDRIKFSERGIITEQIAAVIFGIDNLTVSRGITRTTNAGISGTMGYIFDSAALLYYNDPNPRIRSQNFGITFQKAEPVIDRIRVMTKKSDMIEVSWFYDQKIVLSSSGYLISGTN